MADSAMSKILKGKQPKRKDKKAPDGNRMNADGTAQTLAYYPKPGDGPRTLPGKSRPLLTEGQKTLPEALKKKIIESKKSGAGYSGD